MLDHSYQVIRADNFMEVPDDPDWSPPPTSIFNDGVDLALEDLNIAKPVALHFEPSSYWTDKYNKKLIWLEGSARAFRFAVDDWRRDRIQKLSENPDATGITEISLELRYKTLLYVMLTQMERFSANEWMVLLRLLSRTIYFGELDVFTSHRELQEGAQDKSGHLKSNDPMKFGAVSDHKFYEASMVDLAFLINSVASRWTRDLDPYEFKLMTFLVGRAIYVGNRKLDLANSIILKGRNGFCGVGMTKSSYYRALGRLMEKGAISLENTKTHSRKILHLDWNQRPARYEGLSMSLRSQKRVFSRLQERRAIVVRSKGRGGINVSICLDAIVPPTAIIQFSNGACGPDGSWNYPGCVSPWSTSPDDHL